ncbi:MAG: GNAT family N-acetyltransferase [Variovorax sp.]|nr:MAG: GNAT family N-acetyltransferase [Variovorax sp.]
MGRFARVPGLVVSGSIRSTRRRGAGSLLVHSAIGWAQSHGFAMARLWVGHEEEAAIALYQRCGFVFTGVGRPLEGRPSIVIREMRRALA